jgi:hypothetical protein
MAKNKTPDLPSTPTYQQDPQYRASLDKINKLGGQLTSGDFTGDLAWLKDTVETSPELVQQFSSVLRGALTPDFNRSVQNMKNEVAGANALESSTFTDSLSQLYGGLENNIATQTGTFSIDRYLQNMQNKINIETMGVNALGQGAQLGLSNEQNLNQFNLSNYENQVAQALYKGQNQKGGWAGALQGGLSGAMSGAMVGGIPGAIIGGVGGGLVGGLTPQSTSSQILGMANAGASMYGGLNSAGRFSSNNMFRDTGFQPDMTTMGGMNNNQLRGNFNLNNLYGGLQ